MNENAVPWRSKINWWGAVGGLNGVVAWTEAGAECGKMNLIPRLWLGWGIELGQGAQGFATPEAW